MDKNKWNRASNRMFYGLTDETRWSGPFFFVQMADTQLGFMEENKSWEEEINLAQKAVNRINQMKPRFAIVCGDLVHHLPEMYPNTDQNIRTLQIADYKRIFENVDDTIPLLCVCGNHDVGNRPNAVTIERYKTDFGDDYYSFWVGGVCGIVLNSSLVSDPNNAVDLYDAQNAWFEQVLQEVTKKNPTHVLVFMHHPLFLQYAEEEDDIGTCTWTNADGTTSTIRKSYFPIPSVRRLPLLKLMKKHGVHFVFSGHFHQNCIAESKEYGITNVTTSAVGKQIGTDKSGFRIVQVWEKEIIHEYYDFETTIPQIKCDERLVKAQL